MSVCHICASKVCISGCMPVRMHACVCLYVCMRACVLCAMLCSMSSTIAIATYQFLKWQYCIYKQGGVFLNQARAGCRRTPGFL